MVLDNDSVNGTLVNEQRISAATPLFNNDRIQLGRGGPVLKFHVSGKEAPQIPGPAGQRSVSIDQIPDLGGTLEEIGSSTMVFSMGDVSKSLTQEDLPERCWRN